MKTMKEERISSNRIADTLNKEGSRGKKGGREQAVFFQKNLDNEIHA